MASRGHRTFHPYPERLTRRRSLGQEAGWEPDPTGRHEGRYFAAGHATDLIRDGDVESIDPEGEQAIEQHVDVYPAAPRPAARTSRSRRVWLAAGIIGSSSFSPASGG